MPRPELTLRQPCSPALSVLWVGAEGCSALYCLHRVHLSSQASVHLLDFIRYTLSRLRSSPHRTRGSTTSHAHPCAEVQCWTAVLNGNAAVICTCHSYGKEGRYVSTQSQTPSIASQPVRRYLRCSLSAGGRLKSAVPVPRLMELRRLSLTVTHSAGLVTSDERR